MNIFEQATRGKLRFPSTKGMLTVEDVWILPLTSTRSDSLDSLAKAANAEVKAGEEESFVEVKTTSNTIAQLQLDILKHIIAIRLQENKDKAEAAERKAKKEQILSLIANKENEALANKSTDELQALLAKL